MLEISSSDIVSIVQVENTPGFDGHSLRAAFYFKEELEQEGILIDLLDPQSVNLLKKLDHPLRQDSKAPTFALTFQGTYRTLMKNLGWSEEKAIKVETNYQQLYQVSMQWVQDKIAEASDKGYAEAAFGLRIRVPLLAQTYLGMGKSTPKEAEAEGRTLGNAISGQSYGLLNNRAAVAFMEQVWAHPEMRLKVKPVALIHDAIYLVIAEELHVIEWVNNHLTHAMSWQELPEIQHPEVKLSAELDIFWPDWANPLTLKNGMDQAQIAQACADHAAKIAEKEQKTA